MTGTAAPAANPPKEISDVLEERLIDAEYKVWKKNTPYLYDFVLTHSLEWPSLTCQWFPTVKNAGAHASEHTLLLGTHTTGEQNYIMLASCNIPKEDTVVDIQGNSNNKDNDGNNSYNNNLNNNNNNNNLKKDGRENNNSSSTTSTPHYDEEKKELGGFGHANSNVGKIEIRMKVKHEGEVNRARYMPQNHFIVASRGPSPEVYIFNLSRHPSFPSADDPTPFCPQGVCIGHTKEGYGMVWSPHQEGHLLTASEDCDVILWDVNSATGSKQPMGTQIMPLTIFKGHTGGVEDVDWHERDPNMIGSVGDDKTIRLWDIREKSKVIHVVEDAHAGDVNCIAFNPVNEFVLATGSADKTVALWDMRNLKARVHTLSGHTDQVYAVEWAPFNESILASCSSDRRVAIWDLSRIGAEQTPDDAEDGPPELLFFHGGHTSKVSDFSWNARDEWTIASVSEDNVLQVWNMAEEIYTADDEEEMSSGAGEDKLLGDDDLE